MQQELKKGDKVKVISAPTVENNEYGQLIINSTIGECGTVCNVFKHGARNISVQFARLGFNYYSSENLKLCNKN